MVWRRILDAGKCIIHQSTHHFFLPYRFVAIIAGDDNFYKLGIKAFHLWRYFLTWHLVLRYPQMGILLLLGNDGISTSSYQKATWIEHSNHTSDLFLYYRIIYREAYKEAAGGINWI